MDQAVLRMRAIAPKTMRRLMQTSAQSQTTRNYFNFNYPHGFTGTNNAFNNMPRNEKE